ncbi:glutamate racemase [Thermovenabulum sp.]|uniref:glutamate racemase n=1 Tax=Thermovenabulum sp. TaxID=3100335 RepID=UPI003C7B04C2
MSGKPIGVFDSGIGGLTVAKEIMELLPGESIVYLGDTARVPYGSKSPETITRYAFEGLNFLLSKDVKLVVIACNTVSATCLEKLQESSNVPVIGVIDPGAKAAVRATRGKKVGVIGTERTVKSGAYEIAIKNMDQSIIILSKACPLFVPLVEEGWLDKEATYLTIAEYLMPLKKQGIDTLVLGCTHYPLLKPAISRVLGEGIKLVDCARETAAVVKSTLEESSLLNKKIPAEGISHKYYVTDNPEKFREIGEMFLKRKIEHIEMVRL